MCATYLTHVQKPNDTTVRYIKNTPKITWATKISLDLFLIDLQKSNNAIKVRHI